MFSSDVKVLHSVQAKAAQSPARVNAAAVNVNKGVCPEDLSTGFRLAHAVVQELCGSVPQHHATVGKVNGIRFWTAPKKLF